MKKTLSILLVSLTIAGFAQEQKRTGGAELDLLPYISGGWYVSGWYGVDQFRYRGVYAETTVPDFFVAEGFTDHNIEAAAFIVDYFFKPNFEGWWVGVGYEYWENEIWNSEKTEQAWYVNNVATIGGGFVWKFWGNLYLNPWAAGHILMTGTEERQIGGKSYKPALFTPELSLKLGWHF